ncbi:unnamed protein product [Discula destructiva]
MTDTELKDLVHLHAMPFKMPFKTRLDDDEWPVWPVKDFCIDASLQYTLMQRGLDLAKQIVWSFLDQNHAAKCRATFPGGWAKVRFGRKELEWSFGAENAIYTDTWGRGRRKWAFRQNWPEMVDASLYALIDFRNAVCHYYSTTASGGWLFNLPKIDGWLAEVQQLAIQLYDEERAHAVRRIRDELRQAVGDAAADVEGLAALAVLPFAGYQWEASHEAMFELVHARMRSGCAVEGGDSSVGLPAAIVRAAQSWNPVGGRQRRDPDGLQDSEQAVDAAAEQERLQSRRRLRRGSYCCEAHEAAVIAPGRLRRSSIDGMLAVSFKDEMKIWTDESRPTC